MRKYTKLFVVVFVFSLAIFLSNQITAYFYGKTNKRLHTELIGEKSKFEKLSERAAKLEIQYINQKELAEKVKKEFSKEEKYLRGRIKVLANATYRIRTKARESKRSDLIYQGTKTKYIVNELRYNDGPPIGYVLIFDDGRVVSKIYDHAIDVKTVVARDEKKGFYNIVSRANYILKSPSINFNGEQNWFNKPYELPITGGTAFIDPTELNQNRSRFFWWAPKPNISVNFQSDVSAGFGYSLMGYGKSKNDLRLKFLHLGAQYSEADGAGLYVVPAMIRPFNKTFTNTYIGPGIVLDENGNSYFIGIHLGL